MKIIYKSDDGVAIINPCADLSLEDVVEKSVPVGVDYWIIADDKIPEDINNRDAWNIDADGILYVDETKIVKPDYAELRMAEYPDYRELLDAEVKINSGDEALIAEGQAQKAKYIADCLAVKAKYPKQESE